VTNSTQLPHRDHTKKLSSLLNTPYIHEYTKRTAGNPKGNPTKDENKIPT
jgi:hypothetical protein